MHTLTYEWSANNECYYERVGMREIQLNCFYIIYWEMNMYYNSC